MKILLTGADGQIAYELRRTLAPLAKIVACSRTMLDLADHICIRNVVREVKPDLIVNAAAYTAVDKAESEPDLAMAVNGIAPQILAEEAKRLGGSIVHYSTDYVFDGAKSTPYVEGDTANPLSEYGRTKLAGESGIAGVGTPYLIFRTSWIYGNRGHNFMKSIRRLAMERPELRVVGDQVGAPTWSRLVAEATALVIARSDGRFEAASGVYHLTCRGQASWYDFACAIVARTPRESGQKHARVRSITTAEYPTSAQRPMKSVLDCGRVKRDFGIELPSWDEALALCMDQT